MYIAHWSSKCADCEKSAKGSSACRRPLESQLQQKNASFLVGMEPQWQPKKAAFSA